jgi:methyl-accepting chemotaxis protein
VIRKLKLGTKFTLVQLSIFVIGILLSGVLVSRAVEQRAEQEITGKGVLLIQAMNAVRKYTSAHVNPLLAADLDTADAFISETVPAFSARTVFENLRQNPEYADFIYKEATINPTNPLDTADDFEAQVLQQFRDDPSMTSTSGYREWEGQTVYYSARPLTITAESCLRCHTTPEAAPASLIATYGSENGFGWELNQVISAQMIYVPAEAVLGSARQAFIGIMAATIIMLSVALLTLNYLVRRNVVRPVERIAAIAVKVGSDQVTQLDVDNDPLGKVAERGDELGQLAKVFRQMAENVIKRERQLKQQVRELKIEIDHIKRAQQVEEITGTDYFQNLQSKAKELRDKASKEDAGSEVNKGTE